jgi:hypothetical protein
MVALDIDSTGWRKEREDENIKGMNGSSCARPRFDEVMQFFLRVGVPLFHDVRFLSG